MSKGLRKMDMVVDELLFRSHVYRSDYQPLFGRGARAPPRSHGEGPDQTRHERAAEVEPIMCIDGEKPIANRHDQNERHGVSVCRSLCPSVYGYRIAFLGGGGGHENI